ncbi:hypothetical protein PLESTB_001626100 [Pleodorina starrii]|uniref:Uncharacterized protein n=1 Tax=Pleodorina starrii TaxID=330485 RepID=A0A9W6F8T4_9CHLO|nr:hypothetical protein PLESTB_001626100 [Pleodorina starrii]GLC76650.1 hypothetical protein PLESTF_001809800 [Pleodorina starrii]
MTTGGGPRTARPRILSTILSTIVSLAAVGAYVYALVTRQEQQGGVDRPMGQANLKAAPPPGAAPGAPQQKRFPTGTGTGLLRSPSAAPGGGGDG